MTQFGLFAKSFIKAKELAINGELSVIDVYCQDHFRVHY